VPRFESALCPTQFHLPALEHARCGFLVVLENRSRPEGRTIRLAVAIVPGRALGYDRWNVFGVSYGTDLALTILRDHPEGIRSVILDSTVPPSLVHLSGLWPNARDGFENIFRACQAQARCRSSLPNLEQTFTRLVRRLESHPGRTTVSDPATHQQTPVVPDGGTLANWLVGVSFATPSFKDVPFWIAQLASAFHEALVVLV
jgi:pimeloyl-ACP methyl ester carboxylesterase